MSTESDKNTAEVKGATALNTDVQEAKLVNENPKGGLREDFLRHLESHFDKYELKNNCRVLSSGFFLGEKLLVDVLSAFGMHAARVAGGSATVDEKMIRKLMGTETPGLQYLVEGKECIPGFFIPAMISPNDFKNIALFRGSLIEASEFLHPRDPVLSHIEGVEVKLDRSGFGIYLKSRGDKIFADSAAVQRFYKTLTASPRLRKRYPEASNSLRAALTPLTKLLQNAAPVNKKHLLFIPSAYRTVTTARFLSVGGFVFIIDKNILCFCYELRGGNFRYFVNQELDALRTGKSRKIGKFEVSRKKGAIVGAVEVNRGDKVLVHIELLMQALELMMRRRSLRKKLKNRVTVFDSIKLLSDLLHDTIRVEPHEIPHGVLQGYLSRINRAGSRQGKTGRKAKPSSAFQKSKKVTKKSVEASDLRYRSGNGWIFFIHNKNTARGIAERPKAKKDTPVILKKADKVEAVPEENV